MNRILSWRLRSASITPFTPSPGRPKMTSTPQAAIVSISTSDAVLVIVHSWFLGAYALLRRPVRGGFVSGYRIAGPSRAGAFACFTAGDQRPHRQAKAPALLGGKA